MSNAEEIARMFKVLSVGSRVRIVELLKERSLCVNALAKALDIIPAAVSQHLSGFCAMRKFFFLNGAAIRCSTAWIGMCLPNGTGLRQRCSASRTKMSESIINPTGVKSWAKKNPAAARSQKC